MRWTTVELPVGGVDKFSDAAHVAPGKMVQAENVRIDEPGLLRKRNGDAALGVYVQGGTTLEDLTRVIGHEHEILACNDGGAVLTYDDTNDTWRASGKASNIHGTVESFYRLADKSLRRCEVACSGDLQIVAWIEGTAAPSVEVLVSVVDLRTGANIVHRRVVYSATTLATPFIRAIATATKLRVFFVDVANALRMVEVSVTDGTYAFTSPAATVPTDDLIAGGLFDVCAERSVTDGKPNTMGDYMLAYADATDGKLRVERYNNANAQTGAVGVGSLLPINSLSIASNGTQYVVALTTTTTTPADTVVARLGNIIGASISTAATTTVHTDTSGDVVYDLVGVAQGLVTAVQFMISWRAQMDTSALTQLPQLRYRALSASGALGTLTTLPDVDPVSLPWLHRSRFYQIVMRTTTRLTSVGPEATTQTYADDGVQPTFYVAELSDVRATPIEQAARWCGTARRGVAESPHLPFLPFQVDATSNQQHGLSQVWREEYDAGATYSAGVASRYRLQFAGEADAPIVVARAGLDVWHIDMATPDRYQSAPWGRSLVMAGSMLSAYDSALTEDVGYTWFVESVGQSNAPVAGFMAFTASDTVLWVWVYEWSDVLGNRHQGTPSAVQQYTAPGTVGPTGLGHVLRETLWSNHRAAGVGGNVSNVRVVPYRTTVNGSTFFRDSVLGFPAMNGTAIIVGGEFDDAALQLQELLYTEGEILPNDGPPPGKLIAAHHNRLWMTSDEWIYFTQPQNPGDAPRWSEALRVELPGVTVLHQMDDALIAMTDEAIYALFGSGPPAVGGLDIGVSVVRVSGDTGCSNPQSVAMTPRGLVFLGSKGIYLLTRGRSLEYVGAAVQQYIATDVQRITGCHQVPDRTEVVWTATLGVGEQGGRIVWNYALDQWFTDTLPDPGLSACAAWRHADGRYRHHWAASGVVRAMTSTPELVETYRTVTPWVRLRDVLQGWQFVSDVLLLGDFDSTGDWQVDVGYDYDASYLTTYTITTAKMATLPRGQILLDLAKWDCEAIRIRIRAERTDLRIRSIVFRAGVEDAGPFRVVDAARM